MAIHIKLSPEIEAKLVAQKRNSTIASIFIAILLTLLIIGGLFFIALTPLFKNSDDLVSYYSSGNVIDEIVNKPEVTNEVKKKPSSPSASMAKVISSHTPSPIAIPVPVNNVAEPSLDFGDGNDFGSGWGSGAGNGSGTGSSAGFGLPSSLQKRCTAKDRISRLLKEGGTAEYENQVVNALKWLKESQSSNGSWTAQNKPVAMTGLALLAYLGHCETPSSEEFGEVVQNAIIYLIQISQKQDGKLASNLTDKAWCYEHAIATYALAEAYTLCSEFKIAIPKLQATVLAAGNHIIENQHDSGGWDYSYDTSSTRGGDTSITCWHMQALKACKTTGLKFKNLTTSANKGIAYIEGAKNGKGTIGYETNGKNGKGGPTMTSGAALCLQQWGKGNRSFANNAVTWITQTIKFEYNLNANLYMHYYSSQAAINAQGESWKLYNEKVMKNLAENQNPNGSWNIPGGANHQMDSAHYATCLSTLMMEVYYRFLPSSK